MKLPIIINEQSAEPLYYQIETQLRSLILSGVVVPGTLLPSIREFATQLKCSVITIKRVYSDLEAEGLLRTKQGTGTYVLELEVESMVRQQEEALQEAINSFFNTVHKLNIDKDKIIQAFQTALERYDR